MVRACPKRDSNPHAVSSMHLSGARVYQFRHSGTSAIAAESGVRPVEVIPRSLRGQDALREREDRHQFVAVPSKPLRSPARLTCVPLRASVTSSEGGFDDPSTAPVCLSHGDIHCDRGRPSPSGSRPAVSLSNSGHWSRRPVDRPSRTAVRLSNSGHCLRRSPVPSHQPGVDTRLNGPWPANSRSASL